MKKSVIVFSLLIFGLLAHAEEARIQGSIPLSTIPHAKYSELAKISMEQAIGISQRALKGKILSSALENENGFLVYSVNVDTGRKTEEVLIDAGNGNVLAREEEDLE